MNSLWDNILKREERDKSLGHILSQNILFKNLSKSEIKFVEKIVHKRHYRKGEYVFQQGETGVGMYIIVKGTIEIMIQQDQVVDEDCEALVTTLQEADFFGELSLVEDGGKRSASAKVAEDSILIGFFKPDLMEILERSPTVGVKVVFRLAEVLGRRLKETTDKVSALKKEIYKLSEQKAGTSEGHITKAYTS